MLATTSTGALPVVDEVKKESQAPPCQWSCCRQAIDKQRENPEEANAILHVSF
jgi:hypothetical protein